MLVNQRIEQELPQLVVNREKGMRSRRNRLPSIGAILSAVSAALLATMYAKSRDQTTLLPPMTKLILKETKDPNRKRDTCSQTLQKISNSSA